MVEPKRATRPKREREPAPEPVGPPPRERKPAPRERTGPGPNVDLGPSPQLGRPEASDFDEATRLARRLPSRAAGDELRRVVGRMVPEEDVGVDAAAFVEGLVERAPDPPAAPSPNSPGEIPRPSARACGCGARGPHRRECELSPRREPDPTEEEVDAAIHRQGRKDGKPSAALPRRRRRPGEPSWVNLPADDPRWEKHARPVLEFVRARPRPTRIVLFHGRKLGYPVAEVEEMLSWLSSRGYVELHDGEWRAVDVPREGPVLLVGPEGDRVVEFPGALTVPARRTDSRRHGEEEREEVRRHERGGEGARQARLEGGRRPAAPGDRGGEGEAGEGEVEPEAAVAAADLDGEALDVDGALDELGAA